MTTNTTPPTDDELAAMRARVDAATPGPWSASLLYDVTDTTCIDECDFGFIGDINFPVERAGIEYAEYVFMQPDSPQQKQIHTDAEFIANARSDMQTLLDEVARLRIELEGVHGMIATLPVDELATALEIADNAHEGYRTVNLFTWLSDNGATITGFASQWHDDML